MTPKQIIALSATIVVVAAISATFVAAFHRSDSEILLNANVDALSSSEVLGKCQKKAGECMAVCPACNSSYYVPDTMGPAYNVGGKCERCENEF